MNSDRAKREHVKQPVEIRRRPLQSIYQWFVIAGVCSLAAVSVRADSPESPHEARSRIDKMSAAEKTELNRKCDRFYGLNPDEQDRLKRLHSELGRRPDADRLRGVMERYAEWLKTLPSGQRSELLSLPPEERLAEIKRLMQERETSQMRHFVSRDALSDEDLEAIGQWLDRYIKNHEAELLENAPHFKEKIASLQDGPQRRLLLYFAIRMSPRKDLFRPSDEEIKELEEQLSAQACKQLATAKQDGTYGTLAQTWMRAALYSKRLAPAVDHEQLRKFFHEELDAKQREYLESLPRQRMEFELTRLFQAHQLREYFGGEFPGGFGRPGGGFRGRGSGPRSFPEGMKPGGGGRSGPPNHKSSEQRPPSGPG